MAFQGNSALLTHCIELRSYCTESDSHTHDFAQLVLPVSGSMALEVGHYSGLINEALGVYIAPNERHCYAGSQDNLFLVADVAAKNCLRDKSNILTLSTSTQKLIQFTHHYLAHNERDSFADSLINQLLFHFAFNSFSSEPYPVVIKARQWIDLYFADPVDVSRVARHCFLSVSQLQRRFKQVMGCGMAEYWRMKKLHYAKKLLTQSNLSVEAIALKLGYDHVSAFSRRFSQMLGESPSQWRNNALNGKENA